MQSSGQITFNSDCDTLSEAWDVKQPGILDGAVVLKSKGLKTYVKHFVAGDDTVYGSYTPSEWTLEDTVNGYTFKSETSGEYLAANPNGNIIMLDNSNDERAAWKWTALEDGSLCFRTDNDHFLWM